MTTRLKHALVSLFAAMAALALFLCMRLVAFPSVAEEKEINEGRIYYYSELKNSELAQRFYKAFDAMNGKGLLKKGDVEYDLIAEGVVTEGEIASYVNGISSKVPVALGAARDAYYMDHPELFYIDIYRMSITVGMSDNKYKAYLGTGNSDSYYIDSAMSSEATIATAVQQFDAAVKAAADAARAAGDGIDVRIAAVNKYIVDRTEYDIGAREASDDGRAYDMLVNTAYGALVNGKAMCGGYSAAFKAVMDELGIPCVVIMGSSLSDGTNGYIAHAWNAVKVEGQWYGVDVTWNDGDGISPTQYLLVGSRDLDGTHVEDGIISSSGFKLKYPVLRALPYGVSSDGNGFSFKDSGPFPCISHELGYVTEDGSTSLYLAVGYNNTSAKDLAEQGVYLAVRRYDEEAWTYLKGLYDIFDDDESWYAEGYSLLILNEYYEYAQLAVLDCEPDKSDEYERTIYYNDDTFAAHAKAVSVKYYNDTYGEYVKPPYVQTMIPREYGYIMSLDPIDITLIYDEDLELVEGKTVADVGLVVTGKSADLPENCKVKNVTWDGKRTVKFNLTPSPMYIHYGETYVLTPTNLVGVKSHKEPQPGAVAFRHDDVICPKVFNDGRLYMKIYARPEFVSASDESLNEFKDQNGQPIVGDQRSQLMLVVSAPSAAENKSMEDALLADENIGLEKKDVLASSTYQIDLAMCGKIQKIPDGSYMQVGFGFPEGYGPEDEGVTFTVYHYTRDEDGKITSVEPVPCVITQYGIIATVKSFSPFMICAVPASKVSGRSLYVSVNGEGGSVGHAEIVTLTSDSAPAEYTLSCVAGYSVDRITLNGTDIKFKYDATSGKLTLAYTDLAPENGEYKGNSVVEVTFVANRVAANRAENKLEVAHPVYVVTEKDMIEAFLPGMSSPRPTAPEQPKNITAIVVSIVLSVVLIVGAIVVVMLTFKNKKNAEQPKAAADKTSATRTAAGKSGVGKTAAKTDTRSRTSSTDKKNKK